MLTQVAEQASHAALSLARRNGLTAICILSAKTLSITMLSILDFSEDLMRMSSLDHNHTLDMQMEGVHAF